MPFQNRVTPAGNLEVSKARGQWLGNRGILHNEQQEIVAPWRHKAWVTCQLEFKGVSRQLFGPNRYSELFFLDEATAYAAGHRPCNHCRREAANSFKKFWWQANALSVSGEKPLLSVIDKQLHAERAQRGGGKVSYSAALAELPNGAMFLTDESIYLKWQGQHWLWSHFGYSLNEEPMAVDCKVEVLTPRSIVAALAAGLVAQVHPSASLKAKPNVS